MHKVTHVVGIDPGLVHTGMISMLFTPNVRGIHVRHELVAGMDAAAVKNHALRWGQPPHIFIEAYRPRSGFTTDQRMVEGVANIRAATRGTVLPNLGVTKVVKRPLMELLGVWQFATSSHHQDLRAAARIALLGMLKDETMNALLSQVVQYHLDGQTWAVSH